MAASASSTPPEEKYDVFLSFRGEDTRKNFTSHLHAALCKKKINTFIDDELKRGDQISPSLLNAIQQSKISVIVFSKEYASSRWCLEELAKILECMDEYGQIVMPIFYNIDPSDVRNQTGTFKEAFEKHEERFKGRQEMLQRWRTALGEAANLSGFDSNVFRSEFELVQEVVNVVLLRLNDDSPLIDEDLVGVNSRIKDIEGLLHVGFASVRKIGIWGAGGIGKTTLARAVFNKICENRHFDCSHFFENIREESEKSKGLHVLQRQIICAILRDEDTNTVSTSTYRRRLGCMKVLIVLDDVTDLIQIESLIRDFKCLGSGSRIIITTRDKLILKNCGVDEIYEIKILCYHAALQLFSRHAFRQKCPLVERVLSYANGFPLALKVLGSFLFERTKEAWESALVNLNIKDHKNLFKVLKVSYDGLSENQKAVFLDIACFFKGYKRDLIEATLNARKFDSHNYINVLIERCLITASVNTITMHDLLQEMGREIVQQESIDDPGKRSRLWDHEDILKVLTKNKGTEVIRSIRLDMSKLSELHLKPEAFKNMQNLKFLEVYGFKHYKKGPGLEVLESDSCLLCLNIFKPCFEWFLWKFFEKYSSEHDQNLQDFEVLKFGFSELRYLCWDGYSANSLPPKFNPKNLVVLHMRSSKLKQLWIGDQKQNLVNLKHIDLSYSKHLCRMQNLSITPNLESLILKGCTNLRECFSSIHNLDKLVLLNLRECKNLDMLSISLQSRSLREVILSNCSNLKTVSYISCAVEELYLDGTAIEELPSLEHLSRLVKLSLKNCLKLKILPESIRGCKSLEYLSLSYSSKLDRLPEGLGNLTTLKKLELERISIKEAPLSITCLYNLEAFSLVRCTIENPLSLLPHDLSFWNKLKELILVDSCVKELPSKLGQLHYLIRLCLSGNNFESLPRTIKDLSNLEFLDLRNCQRLKSLPELPHQLGCIRASGCMSLEELSGLPSHCLSMWCRWEEINFSNCFKLKLHALSELKEALLNIQRNANLWFHLKEKGPKLPSGIQPRSCICYPGSEIPDWFNFIGNDDFVKLPTGWLNDNLIGFVVCVVVSFSRTKRCSGYLDVGYRLVVNEKVISYGVFFNYIKLDDVIDSDHVFLGYDYDIMSFELLTLSSNSDGCIKLFVRDSFGSAKVKTSGVGKVKKCGVRLFYAEDNDLRRDGRLVEREQRLKSINCSVDDCLRCCVGGCCWEHPNRSTDYWISRAREIVDRWSPHPGLYYT